MKKGDHVLFYHSQNEKAVVGIAKVIKENYPDPTAETGDQWSVVDLAPVRALKKPVTLESIKADKRLSQIALVRQSRLSVTPLAKDEFDSIIAMEKE
jgi:predicted RNA-binding protein with PUA-like domain